MAVTARVLFEKPQHAIASLLLDRWAKASAVSIVAGFSTPAGVELIKQAVAARPKIIQTVVVGAATYLAFEAFDNLIAVGVPADRLYANLGHSRATGGHKNPFARFHPMLHSKIYYMEGPERKACAFIGSHNLTGFALGGLNAEAGVLLEGDAASVEFDAVRQHIWEVRKQSVLYSPAMKEALAWWTREYLEGLRAEIGIPQDWLTVRTILLFAAAAPSSRPNSGDQIYFEIPAGIEQIESLKTETHLFLFDKLPAHPWEALMAASRASAAYTCKTLGAENKQGNMEVRADWRLDATAGPTRAVVPSKAWRPNTSSGMQQVRAEVDKKWVVPFEYLFDRGSGGWEPEFSEEENPLRAGTEVQRALVGTQWRGSDAGVHQWRRVTGVAPRAGVIREKDEVALRRAAPESGSFILVSLRRRRKEQST